MSILYVRKWALSGGGHHVVKIVNTLLKNAREPDPKDSQGQTPLSWAAAQGHEGVVNLLLSQQAVELDSVDFYGQTPLSRAAEEGHEAMVKLLLSCDDVAVNSQDTTGMTPLLWAVARGHPVVSLALENKDEAIIRVLLQNKAEIDAPGPNSPS